MPTPPTLACPPGMCILMDILGEVGEDTGGRGIEEVLLAQVLSPSGPVRNQAAQAVAALAAAQPSAAARILSELLDNLEGLAQQLGEQASPTAGEGWHTAVFVSSYTAACCCGKAVCAAAMHVLL